MAFPCLSLLLKTTCIAPCLNSVPQNGDQVQLRIAIAGRVVGVPTALGAVLFWYGWIPHESRVVTKTHTRSRPSRAPADGLELDERAYATTYCRMAVERLGEVVAARRAAAGRGGLSPAPNLLIQAAASLEP